MTQTDSLFHPGDVIAAKYRVERVLGIGGMGAVFEGWHLDLERRVAIKVMLPAMAASGEAVARFMREARAAVRLKSEHVAQVLDVGKLDSGAPYIVMEMLQGDDLSGVLRQKGSLPLTEAVDLLVQACEAIAEAHAQGIVHRDLKPANLFLTRDAHGGPCVKVLDFGISKVRSATGGSPGDPTQTSGLTNTSAMMGTPMYMSPEQMRSSKDVDGRSDIWALGAILYELLTGHVAFGGEEIPQVVAAVMLGPVPCAREVKPELPAAVDAIIARCLERDRDSRYTGVADLVSELARFGSPRAQLSLERLVGSAPETAMASGIIAVPRSGSDDASRLPEKSEAQQAPSQVSAISADGKPSTKAAFGTARTLAGSNGSAAGSRRPNVMVAAMALSLMVAGGALWWRFGLAPSNDSVVANQPAAEAVGASTSANASAAVPVVSPALAVGSAAEPDASPRDSAPQEPAAVAVSTRERSRSKSAAPEASAGTPSTPPTATAASSAPVTTKAPPTGTLTDFGGRE